MSIKALIFDLDGVLHNSCNIHYVALNKAIEEIAGIEYIISEDEHQNDYNGLNTTMKLQKLVQNKKLDLHLCHPIANRKQELTLTECSKIERDVAKISMITKCKQMGYKIACASNCIPETQQIILTRLGIFELFDLVLSNRDVKIIKPNSEIYLTAFIRLNLRPRECLIFEDSIVGIKSAVNSCGNVCYVNNSNEMTIEKIEEAIEYYSQPAEKQGILRPTCFMKRLTIIIPMSGNGNRFVEKGYKNPKPLINVFHNTPMITTVIKNLQYDANFIFIVKKNHCKEFKLDCLLNSLIPDCHIIQIDKTTEGAACTVLLGKECMKMDSPLLIANCDQFLEWDANEFLSNFIIRDQHLDAVISTFLCPERSTKWSYASVNTTKLVTEVKEKIPISDIATTGIYVWRYARDFVKYAECMIDKNIRHNNEFYVAPVFNEAIADGKRVGISNCKRMWSLGVPDDLEYFQKYFLN